MASVNLSHNQIETLERGSFENCINLTSLDLSFNKIAGINDGVFDVNSYAGHLDLSHNLITNFSKVNAFVGKSLASGIFFISAFFGCALLFKASHSFNFLALKRQNGIL